MISVIIPEPKKKSGEIEMAGLVYSPKREIIWSGSKLIAKKKIVSTLIFKRLAGND